MPASDRVDRSPHRPVPMRDLLASCAAARAVSTPPWHPHPPVARGAGAGTDFGAVTGTGTGVDVAGETAAGADAGTGTAPSHLRRPRP